MRGEGGLAQGHLRSPDSRGTTGHNSPLESLATVSFPLSGLCGVQSSWITVALLDPESEFTYGLWEILTNSAWPGGTTAGQAPGIRAVAPGMEQVGRVGGPTKSWGVLNSGCLLASEHLALLKCGLYFPVLHFPGSSPGGSSSCLGVGPRGSAMGFGGGET